MVRESTLNLFQYVTAAILVVFLTIHVLTHVPGVLYPSYRESLKLRSIYDNYALTGWILGIVLIAAAIHGLNGLRGVLLELRQGRYWELFINMLIVALITYTVGLGFLTLIRWVGILYWSG